MNICKSKKLKQMLNFKEIIFLALANKISKHNCLIFDLSLKKCPFIIRNKIYLKLEIYN